MLCLLSEVTFMVRETLSCIWRVLYLRVVRVFRKK